MTDPQSLWLVLGLATFGTFIWRAAGMAIASKIKANGDVFNWIACIAYAMLAALIARIMILPVGTLADTPMIDRLIALAVGFILFFLTGRTLWWGLGSAVLIFTSLSAARAFGLL